MQAAPKGGAKQRALASAIMKKPASARPSESDKQSKAEQSFRDLVSSLFLTNKLSGVKMHALVTTGHDAGAGGVPDLARYQAPQNATRDFLTTLLKGSTKPPLYFASIPLKRKDTGAIEHVRMPFLLPHEMIAHIVGKKDLAPFQQWSPEVKQQINKVCSAIKGDIDNFIGIGLHGDGVPHQKRKSIEVLSWNIVSAGMSTRVPFAILEKEFACACGCSGRHSLEPMLEVFTWSIRCLMSGKYPTIAHDGTPMKDYDKGRAAKFNGPLPCIGGLAQLRGDWAWYKQIFQFPAWSNHSICWLCNADKGEHPYWDFSLTAAWRRGRYSEDQFWRKMRGEGIEPSCLFGLPGVSRDSITIDILHALDLGCAQDIVGNVMWSYMQSGCCIGPNRKAHIDYIVKKMKMHYKAMHTPNRLQTLTKDMLNQRNKGPKLRAKGAETRNVVPFAVQLAQELHQYDPTPENETILQMVASLMDYYLCLGLVPFDQSLAAKCARQCCILYSALKNPGDDRRWRVKPKFHLWSELSEFSEWGDPSFHWCYMDEDFVGWIAQLAGSQGGPRSAQNTALKVLKRYLAS